MERYENSLPVFLFGKQGWPLTTEYPFIKHIPTSRKAMTLILKFVCLIETNQNTLFMNPTFVVRTMFISLVYKYLHIEIQEI